MRIAIVADPRVPIPPKQYGGTEQVIYYLIKGLIEAGHEPILIGTADSTVDCEIVPIIETALGFPKQASQITAHERLIQKANRRIDQQLRKLAPTVDIIHSHGYDLKRFSDFPNLTTVHSKIGLTDLPYYKRRQNLYYASISHNQQETLPALKYMGVVYNGEDPSDFPIVSDPQDYVCFLGRFDRDKNPHLAIELALSYGIKIKLAGKIDHLGEGYFEQEVQKYFKHPLVEYLGELGFEEKVRLLSRAKCNLHPTGFREPFGLTVLEAAYCGTPTLAVSRGSMPELIEANRTGVLVEDFDEGYHRLKDCFEMDRAYVASRSRALFNYQNMTKQYVEVYERVMEAVRFENSSKPNLPLFLQPLQHLGALWHRPRPKKSS
jgi:glycosyltransferase involved in cell wall biosynthesis